MSVCEYGSCDSVMLEACLGYDEVSERAGGGEDAVHSRDVHRGVVNHFVLQHVIDVRDLGQVELPRTSQRHREQYTHSARDGAQRIEYNH